MTVVGYAWILHLNDVLAADLGAPETFECLADLTVNASRYKRYWATSGPWGTTGVENSSATKLSVWTHSKVTVPADDPGHEPVWTVPEQRIADPTVKASLPSAFVTYKQLPAAGDTFSAWTLQDLGDGTELGGDVYDLIRSYLEGSGTVTSATVGAHQDAFKFAGQAPVSAPPQTALWYGNVLVCAERDPVNDNWSLSDLGGWADTDLLLFECGRAQPGARTDRSELPGTGAWVYSPVDWPPEGRRRTRTSRFLAGPSTLRFEAGGCVIKARGVTEAEVHAALGHAEEHLAVAAIGARSLEPNVLAGLLAPHLPDHAGALIEVAGPS